MRSSALCLAALLPLLLWSTPARSAPPAPAAALSGEVVDALTGLPVVEARVQVLQTGQEVTTDDQGRYELALPEGRYSLRVLGPQGAEALLVRQRAASPPLWPTQIHLQGLGWHQRAPSLPRPWGLPSTSGALDPSWGPVTLEAYWARRLGLDPAEVARRKLTMPTALPATVRVGRRFADTCRGNAIREIQAVPLEEYVQGVLIPEIGVFRSTPAGREAAREVFKAFAIAARTYALYFVIGGFNDDEGYDLDDTACNQRYTDDRDPWVEALVAETAGQVLVREGTTDTFDKFEYAASCGRHSTWPEYAPDGDYVSDAGLTQVCVGSWCGHNNCAAHQDNPQLPGDDRCLVRGLCQWGGLERSAAGQDHLEILAHYQPHLTIRGATVEPQGGAVKGFVRAGASLEEGAAIPGATVALDSGQAVIVGQDGYFEFNPVDPGPRAMTAQAEGYAMQRRELTVTAGQDTWQSVLLEPLPPANNDAPDLSPDPDLTPEPDLTPDPDLAADLAPSPDQGVEADLPSGEDAPAPDQGAEPDLPGQGTSSERFTVFATVPPEGLNGDDGCGCATAARPAGGWRAAAALLLALLLVRRPSPA